MSDPQKAPRTDHNEAIAEFTSITGEPPEIAAGYLASSSWVMEDAMTVYYEARDEPQDEDDDEEEGHPAEVQVPAPPGSGGMGVNIGGGRRLGEAGDPTPPQPSTSSASSSSRAKPPAQRKMFGTLKDISGDSHAGHGHGDDDEASDKEQEFYAGGDKSGLAVQDPNSGNPRDQIQRLMNTARRGGARPAPADGAEEEAPSRRSFFGGSGQTLGGDDIESQVIPATQRSQPPRSEMVERILHLWQDGFSVDDGPLYRYDDPANRRTLDMINSGSAPMDLMNVQNGQAVDVKLMNHPNDNYVQPKKKYKPFEAGGQRLGSPTPGVTVSSGASSQTISSSTAVTSDTSSAAPPSVDIDSSAPTLSIQIRLADGTRLPSRFNTTHTIGDVYNFIERSQPGGPARPYVLATTFPTKDLTDKSQVLGDMAEFKRGGVVVQKWA